MKTNTLYSPNLERAIELPLPVGIIEKAKACLNEDAAYAADELVELAEEILSQMAAVGFVAYLQSSVQKEVYNDFLIGLFTSSGYDYNAGPLFRWAAFMIKDCPQMRSFERFRFFWKTDGKNERLKEQVNSLSDLRNRVMHGFFVLPPEENNNESEKMGQLLIDLDAVNFFSQRADYHFLRENPQTSKWRIKNDSDWARLTSDSLFGKLVGRILLEESDTFWEAEAAQIQANLQRDIDLPAGFIDFIEQNYQGAYACWVHPRNQGTPAVFAAMVDWVRQQPDCLVISYRLHDTGISFTKDFLLKRLVRILNNSDKALSAQKRLEDQIKDLLPQHKEKKIVVLIDCIHTALFSPQHVSKLSNFLFENNILMVAVGHHYEHFDRIFKKTVILQYPSAVPNDYECFFFLHNYLRFKGPFADRKEDLDDVLLLREIGLKLCEELRSGKEVYARRFADTHGYDIENVHELFALLHPWVKSTRKPFEEDTIDELNGYPVTITETTPIYLALGRRDIKLEYQHKVLSIN